MRSKKGDARAIVMLLFGLVAIILIWVQMRQAAPKLPAEVSRLDGKRMAIFDSTYVNLSFQFLIRMPNRYWQLSALTADTALISVGQDLSLENQILWLLSGKRAEKSDTSAMCRIGVLSQAERTAGSLAVNYLAEQISEYEQDNARVRILQPVTERAHAILKGVYYAVVLPSSSEIQMPVRIVAVLHLRD